MTKIIAELCQNHNGDLKILEEMVHAASEAGAEIVKIQSMLSDDLTHRERFEEGVKKDNEVNSIKRPYKTEYERLKKLDLNDEQHFIFLDYCKKYKVEPMTTIFSRSRLNFLESLDIDIIKVSSFDCASHQMIEELSESKFKEIIVSTGCTFDDEIKKTCNILNKKDKKFSLLHCVSIYPTPLEEVHLDRIEFLKELNQNVGLSEHSNCEKDKLKTSIASLLYDVKYIERHFTILPKDQTKDGVVSLDPTQLKELCDYSKKSIKEIEEYVKKEIPEFNMMKGKKLRPLSRVEMLNRDYYQGRFASKNKEGEVIYNWEDKKI